MSRTLTNTFIENKNAQTNKPVYLYTLYDYDDASSNLYFAEYNEDITYDGQTYQAFPITYDIVSENMHGEIDTIKLAVSNVSRLVEAYIENYRHFTGIANATKIVAYKIVNQTGKGYVSDLISAMASVILNRTTHHIVSVCLSIGTLGEDVSAINRVIDEVIENHILVVIAAGNNGIEGSEPFNKLGRNKNAIVEEQSTIRIK